MPQIWCAQKDCKFRLCATVHGELRTFCGRMEIEVESDGEMSRPACMSYETIPENNIQPAELEIQG